MQVREPAIAGTFYPATRSDLAALLDRCWAQRVVSSVAPPKAMIAPHAGLVYSGPIAASAYSTLQMNPAGVTRVILLGPSHRFGFDGFAVPSHAVWRTPMGDVPLDRVTLDALAQRPDVAVSDSVHAQEHSLEVHLPFLQRVLDPFHLVPIAVGRTSVAQTASLLRSVWGGSETLVVVSSDLSHFFSQSHAMSVDGQTSATILALDAEKMLEEDACGRFPAAGLLAVARGRQMKVATVDRRTSADTAGDPARVVGYGSYLFWERQDAPTTERS